MFAPKLMSVVGLPETALVHVRVFPLKTKVSCPTGLFVTVTVKVMMLEDAACAVIAAQNKKRVNSFFMVKMRLSLRLRRRFRQS
jgi:hypothetical protein